ncbi:SIMPL domain-containing protein [Aliikangiella coralliicola]|uniref:DUF541 domain-containing protein n=1 Tax=Aliikangiella coralliicola TaxID=2592383 RepID=A0A545UK61_9GAMM|nr:SIMPL domain-containing protein [Aliikangiella coralliicola]TQV89848.1 DUF541 domain-containing protein [Aliikangiella coralliicola]
MNTSTMRITLTKLTKLFFLLVIVNLTSLLSVNAQSLDQPHISVQGSASQSISPDELSWSLAIKTLEKELPLAAKKHAETSREVMRLLKQHKIDAKDIQTTQMQFGENKQYKHQSWVIEGYFASSQITFKLRDLDKYSKLWKALVKQANVSMNGFSYGHSKYKKIQNEVQQQALLVAKKKAEKLARTLKNKVGRVLVIEEEGSNPIRPYVGSRMQAMDASAESQPIAHGTITINARIKAVFQLVE